MDGSARLTGPVAGPPWIIMTGFDAAELARRYPGGPGEYAAAFRAATVRAAAAGFVLEQDVEEMVAVAAVAYPGPGAV